MAFQLYLLIISCIVYSITTQEWCVKVTDSEGAFCNATCSEELPILPDFPDCIIEGPCGTTTTTMTMTGGTTTDSTTTATIPTITTSSTTECVHCGGGYTETTTDTTTVTDNSTVCDDCRTEDTTTATTTSTPTITTTECPHGEFICASGLCIVQLAVCDGQSDCPDGEDEKECVGGFTDLWITLIGVFASLLVMLEANNLRVTKKCLDSTGASPNPPPSNDITGTRAWIMQMVITFIIILLVVSGVILLSLSVIPSVALGGLCICCWLFVFGIIVNLLILDNIKDNKVYPESEDGRPSSSASDTTHGASSSKLLLISGIIIFISLMLAILAIFLSTSLASLQAAYGVIGICIFVSILNFGIILLIQQKMKNNQSQEQHDDDAVSTDNKPLTMLSSNGHEFNHDERSCSPSLSIGRKIVWTPHGAGPSEEDGDFKERKTSAGSQAGDTHVLIQNDTVTSKPKNNQTQKKKRGSKTIIELAEIRHPSRGGSYGHIYNEEMT